MGVSTFPPMLSMPRPGPAKAPARPRLATTAPRRLAARLEVASIVKAWMLKRGVTTQDLADIVEESAATLHDRLTGEKPMPVEILVLLPRKDRARVFALLEDIEPVAA
jgi:hypothetical protein